MIIFYPVKVVGRGSETQLQVGKKLNQLNSHYNSPVVESSLYQKKSSTLSNQ